jgi:hypothetical protein
VYPHPNEENVPQRYDILIVMTMQLTAIWDVMSCSLEDTHQPFRILAVPPKGRRFTHLFFSDDKGLFLLPHDILFEMPVII